MSVTTVIRIVKANCDSTSQCINAGVDEIDLYELCGFTIKSNHSNLNAFAGLTVNLDFLHQVNSTAFGDDQHRTTTFDPEHILSSVNIIEQMLISNSDKFVDSIVSTELLDEKGEKVRYVAVCLNNHPDRQFTEELEFASIHIKPGSFFMKLYNKDTMSHSGIKIAGDLALYNYFHISTDQNNHPVIGTQMQMKLLTIRKSELLIPEIKHIQKICSLAIEKQCHVQFVQF